MEDFDDGDVILVEDIDDDVVVTPIKDGFGSQHDDDFGIGTSRPSSSSWPSFLGRRSVSPKEARLEVENATLREQNRTLEFEVLQSERKSHQIAQLEGLSFVSLDECPHMRVQKHAHTCA